MISFLNDVLTSQTKRQIREGVMCLSRNCQRGTRLPVLPVYPCDECVLSRHDSSLSQSQARNLQHSDTACCVGLPRVASVHMLQYDASSTPIDTRMRTLMTMLGKSNMCTSSGSSIPFLVTMICFGCSSTGMDRISAATYHSISVEPQHATTGGFIRVL